MKILIVQIGRIGDMILTTPMFSAVKKQFPESELHVLASGKGFPVVAGNPLLSGIILYKKGMMGLLAAMLKVRKERYDLWIDPKDHGSSESSFLAQFSGAKEKIGFNKEGKKIFTTSVPSEKENFFRHAVERNLQALISKGVIVDNNARPELFVPSETEKQMDAAVAGGERIAVVNISAGQHTREWNEQGWERVIEHCFQKHYGVALAFQPADAERAQKFKNRFPRLIAPDSPTIGHAIALIRRAALVVTVDTSIVHIASAFNTPIVALYPAVEWNYNKFKPLSDKQSVVFSSSPNSLRDISAEAVLSKIDELTTD